MHLLTKLLAGAALAFGLSSAQAVVIDGTINMGSQNGQSGVVVNTIQFTVTQAGWVSFDMLAIEDGSHDYNGDGELTAFDSYLMLFAGPMGMANLIAQNDDGHGAGFGDGSWHDYDSFLNVFLEAGTYTLAIGTCCSPDLMVTGFMAGHSVWNELAHADYRLTILGNVLINEVPEPASAALLALGLLGFAGLRRRAA